MIYTIYRGVYLVLHTFNMLWDVWHLPTACMRPSIKIVCCSLYPYRHNLVEFTLRIFHTCELFARIPHSMWRIRTNLLGPFLILLALLDAAFLTDWELSSVRLSVQLLSYLLQDHCFFKLGQNVPLVVQVSKRIPVRRQTGPPSAIFDVSCYRISSETTWRIRMKLACCVCLNA